MLVQEQRPEQEEEEQEQPNHNRNHSHSHSHSHSHNHNHNHNYNHNQMMMTTTKTMMKRKRTKRSRTASPLTLTIPTSAYDTCRVAASSSTTSSPPHPTEEEEEDMANCLILLAQGPTKTQKLNYHVEPQAPITAAAAAAVPPPKETAPGMFVYECKTCSRCFPSFQALGGHRASHRKPKLSLSEDHRNNFQSAEMGKLKKVEQLGLSLQMACNSSNTLSGSNNNHKPNKVHACAICGAEFASGQALGGHMRRHRPIATSTGGSPATAKSAPPPKTGLCLDLNLPADEEEEQQVLPESPKFMFASTEKTLVFANSLVDCRY